jgi:protein involved in polysaccharide export with SLBB domain
MLDLRFARNRDWNQTARVRADGHLSFPVIGDVRVAGFSVPELERTLGEKYHPILVEPDLNVNFGESVAAGEAAGTAGVVFSGEVTRPGLVAMSGERLTLIEALGRAGGQLKATALLGNTLMLRRSPQTGLYRGWRIDAREIHWETAEPVWLQRHDLIFVPNTPIDNVDIWVDQYINKMLPLGLASFALGIVVGAR